MSVATLTTDYENGVGVVVLGWQTTRAWIPAYVGMTVGVVRTAIFRGMTGTGEVQMPASPRDLASYSLAPNFLRITFYFLLPTPLPML